jgi:hypothetical protein
VLSQKWEQAYLKGGKRHIDIFNELAVDLIKDGSLVISQEDFGNFWEF